MGGMTTSEALATAFAGRTTAFAFITSGVFLSASGGTAASATGGICRRVTVDDLFLPAAMIGAESGGVGSLGRGAARDGLSPSKGRGVDTGEDESSVAGASMRWLLSIDPDGELLTLLLALFSDSID